MKRILSNKENSAEGLIKKYKISSPITSSSFHEDISKYTGMRKVAHGSFGSNKENCELDINKLSSLTTTFSGDNVRKSDELTKVEDEMESYKENSAEDVTNTDKISSPLTSFSCHEDVSKDTKMTKIGQGTSGSFKETLAEIVNKATSSVRMFPSCENVSKYPKLAKIGHGTFGEVFKAINPKTNGFVALKKVLQEDEKEGFPANGINEIKLHQQMNNENIVRLIEVCCSPGSAKNSYKSTFHLVLEFCEHDLAGLLSNIQFQYEISEIKMIMKQLFNGLYYLHGCKIMHRDLKSSNILMTKHGILKIADFGLSCVIKTVRHGIANHYTNKVVTLWYRSPELLLGETSYGASIDMWSAGCIMAEMWTRRPILQGNSEHDQLKLICELCGPMPDSYESIKYLDKKMFSWSQKQKMNKSKRKEFEFKIQDPLAIELMFKLLELNPSNRISAEMALDADYFYTDPMPIYCKLATAVGKIQSSSFEYLSHKNEYNQHQVNRPSNVEKRHVSNDEYQDRIF